MKEKMMKYLRWMKSNGFAVLVAKEQKVSEEVEDLFPHPGDFNAKQLMNMILSGKRKIMHVEALNVNKVEDWFTLNLGSEIYLRNFHALIILNNAGDIQSVFEFGQTGEYNNVEWTQSFAFANGEYHYIDSKWLKMFLQENILQNNELFELITRPPSMDN